MIEKPYFVILNHQKKDIFLPFLDEDGELAMFETEIEAICEANQNPLGNVFGFEVFELGSGRCV